MLPQRSEIAPQILTNFKKNGWPKTTLISGIQCEEKNRLLWDSVEETLFENRFHRERQLADIQYLLRLREHPDCYTFPDASIAIGEEGRSSEKGTIRHLLRHFIPYSPRESKQRFVVFQNASRIGNEAESALLKVLEEPPGNTHFILSCLSPNDMKATIRSRSLVVPFIEKNQVEKIPVDPWERFWFFSGQTGSAGYKLIQKNQWKERIKERYDHFSYNSKDFLIFDSLGANGVKKYFPKESLSIQNQVIFLSFLPLYFSLRDCILEGKTATLGPIRVPRMEITHSYGALLNLRKLFWGLRRKYFQTIAASPMTVYYEFISRFMNYWLFLD